MALLPLPHTSDFETLLSALRQAFDAIEKHERWHEIAGDGEISFASGWVNLTGWRRAAYRKNALGDVQFFGVLENPAPGFGTGNNTSPWTFPEGYRPPGLISFPAVADQGGTFYPALITVAANGVMTLRVPALPNGDPIDQFHVVGRFRTQ